MMHKRGADTPVLAIIMVREDCSNLMRLNASILTVLAATQYRQNRRVKAKGRSTCSTLIIGRQSLTYPIKTSFSCGECLLQIPCWLLFYLGSFCYRSHAGFFFMRGVSLTHPVLPSGLCEDFLLHIPCWPCWLLFYVGIFSYTSRAGFNFTRGILLLHIPCSFYFYLGSFFYTSRASFTFMWEIFSYTSRAGFFFFLLLLLLLFFFFFFFFSLSLSLFLGSFSYICSAGSIFIRGVSFTIPCWLL